MAIVYPREFPDDPFQPVRCTFDREPLGAISRSAGGYIAFQEFIGGGLWRAHFETKPLNETGFGRWHAWKLSMRGNLTFKAYDPRRCYPIAYGPSVLTLTRAAGGTFDGTVTVTAVNGKTIHLSGLPADFTITAGDYISFMWLGAQHLLKFLETITADSSGVIVHTEIDPWLRSGGDVPVTGTIVRAWCEMKIIPGSWNGDRMVFDPVSFDAIQYLGPAHIIDAMSFGPTAAWFTAYNNDYMTVNADGTGGEPADGGTVGRWTDRSGNGNHVSGIGATNTYPMWRNGHGLNFRSGSSSNNSTLRNNSTTSISSRDSSGGMIIWLSSSGQVPLIDFGTTASGFALMTRNTAEPRPQVHTSLAFEFFTPAQLIPARRAVVTWRANATELIIRINGDQATHAPHTSLNMSNLYFGTFAGGGTMPLRIFEAVVYDEDIGPQAIVELEDYLRTNAAGTSGDPTRTVFILGDSLSLGTGSDLNKPWHNYITNRSNSTWYTWVAAGDPIWGSDAIFNDLAPYKGSAESVVIIWKGTNDIIVHSRTGAQVEADFSAACTGLKNAGHKVIVATLQHFATGNAERIAFNTLLKANYTNYADGIVLLDEAPELDDGSDATYYLADGIHLKDAGYAAAAALFQAALTALP